MTEETSALYEVLFSMEEVRELLRQTAPDHRLSDEQKRQFRELLERVRKSLDLMEGRLG